MAKRNTFFAKKTECRLGHLHDSKREADRCHELQTLLRAGEIEALSFEPVWEVEIDGRPVKMGNGHTMRFTPDFSYVEGGKVIYEDVKPKNGYMSRDVPVKIALFRHLNPNIDLRIVT
jgi:hypothetical protein